MLNIARGTVPAIGPVMEPVPLIALRDCPADQLLIIFRFDLKIGLGVVANRAYLRGFFAKMNMSAVSALPGLLFLSFKNLAFFKVLQ